MVQTLIQGNELDRLKNMLKQISARRDKYTIPVSYTHLFHALGREIKRKREAKGWTQEYLAQLVDRTPRSIMYFENRGQHPSLNTFYQIVTLLDISVDQFFYPDRQNGESDCRQHIDRLLNTMDEKELTVMEATAEGLQKARETEVK